MGTRVGRWLIGMALVLLAACGGGGGPTTPSQSATVVAVQSEGTISHSAINGGGATTFTRNGLALFSKTGGGGGARGFSVATLDGGTGQVLSAGTNFDTWLDVAQKAALVSYLDAIPSGRIVLLGVADDAGFQTAEGTAAVVAALERRGCKRIREYGYRDSYACIFVTGEAASKAEAFSESAAVTVQYTMDSK